MTKPSPLALELGHVGAVRPDERPPEPPGDSAPPHPFRTSPWYDPAAHARELGQARPLAAGLRRRIAPFVLVILGGAALPVASLITNYVFERVVALGLGGAAALILAVLATLANLLLLPTRKTASGQVVLVRAPRSTLAVALLTGGALLSALFWAYLSLLFLPLAPISVVAIAFFGLGLCGLSPHFAAAVGIIQSMRACRMLRSRVGAGRTAAFAAGVALLPVLAAVGVSGYERLQQARLDETVGQVVQARPNSVERMRLIARLDGEEERVAATFWREQDDGRRRALAEVYHRLTDEQLTAGRYRLSSRALIRPWWFTEPMGARRGLGPYDFFSRIFGGLP